MSSYLLVPTVVSPTPMLQSFAEVSDTVSIPSDVHRYETPLALCYGPHDCAGLMRALLLLDGGGNHVHWVWILP